MPSQPHAAAAFLSRFGPPHLAAAVGALLLYVVQVVRLDFRHDN